MDVGGWRDRRLCGLHCPALRLFLRLAGAERVDLSAPLGHDKVRAAAWQCSRLQQPRSRGFQAQAQSAIPRRMGRALPPEKPIRPAFAAKDSVGIRCDKFWPPHLAFCQCDWAERNHPIGLEIPNRIPVPSPAAVRSMRDSMQALRQPQRDMQGLPGEPLGDFCEQTGQAIVQEIETFCSRQMSAQGLDFPDQRPAGRLRREPMSRPLQETVSSSATPRRLQPEGLQQNSPG